MKSSHKEGITVSFSHHHNRSTGVRSGREHRLEREQTGRDADLLGRSHLGAGSFGKEYKAQGGMRT